MSFANKKKSSLLFKEEYKNKSQISIAKNLVDSTFKYSSASIAKQDPILSRLDMVENNLTRVLNQHEALLPLVTSPPDLHILNKHEFAISILRAKLQEEEKKLKNFDENLKTFQSSIEGTLSKVAASKNDKSVEVQNLEKAMKGTNNMINGLQSNLKDVESTVLNFQRLTDSSFKEISQEMILKVDSKTQRNQEDVKKIISEFENYIKRTLKGKMETLGDLPTNVYFLIS